MKTQVYQSEYNGKYEINLMHGNGCSAIFHMNGKYDTKQEALAGGLRMIQLVKKNIGECRQCYKTI